MTYKLEPRIIEKIMSPITLILPGTDPLYFRNHTDLLETVFDTPYIISSITAVNDSIVLKLEEVEPADVPFDGDK